MQAQQQLEPQLRHDSKDDAVDIDESATGNGTMGKVSVRLENKTVHAGDELKGYVDISSTKSEIDEVALKLEGVGTVRLEADNGKTYSAHETYFYDKLTLWSKSTSSEARAKGAEMRVPFVYKIPNDARGSFDGHHAKVVYTCTAIVKYVGALSRKQHGKSKFYVLPAFDASTLDDSVDSTSPKKVNKRKAFSSFGIKDGFVEVEVDLDKRGVQRGESLGLTVSVKNDSELYLRSVKFGIMQIVKSSVKGRQVIEKSCISEFDENGFLLKPKESWCGRRVCSIDANLQPSLMAQGNKVGCQVAYEMFVTIVPPNFAPSCELHFPLYVY